MRTQLTIVLVLSLSLGNVSHAAAWDLSVPSDADTLVRTYYNPVFGPFDTFTLPKNDKKSWDIQNYGVFFLNIYCSSEKYLVLTKYQKWNDESSVWETIAFPKSSNLSLKFGNAKAISWATKLENDVDGVVISNPKLFVNKISSVKSLEYPIRIDGKSYKVKFNIAGFRSYLSDLQDAGC
jgi:hypothetical protein